MFAIMTRFFEKDYEAFESSSDKGKYNFYVDSYKKKELNHLIETTRGTVLYWQGKLFVTGIATSRKDSVGTSIRYSLLLGLDKSKCRDWFGRFATMLECNKDSLPLGQALDDLCGVTQRSEALLLPSETALTECLDKSLPQSRIKNPIGASVSGEECWIWSEFCPVNPAQKDVQQFLDSLKNIPVGTWYFSKPIGQEVVKKKTMSRNHFIILGMLLLIGLGYWAKTSCQHSDLTTQIQVLEKNNAEMSKRIQSLQKELESCQTENKKLREELQRANKPIGE